MHCEMAAFKFERDLNIEILRKSAKSREKNENL